MLNFIRSSLAYLLLEMESTQVSATVVSVTICVKSVFGNLYEVVLRPKNFYIVHRHIRRTRWSLPHVVRDRVGNVSSSNSRSYPARGWEDQEYVRNVLELSQVPRPSI